MAVLFSAVTLTVNGENIDFLVSGFPNHANDLHGWTVFEDFMEQTAHGQEVDVHARAYCYGGGDIVKATPEEVAYFTMRTNANEEFLHDHCEYFGDSNFTVTSFPDEAYTTTLMEQGGT